MKFLPVEKLTFESTLTEKQIQERLLNVVQPKAHYKPFTIRTNSDSSKTYEGKLNERGFLIRRIIRGRNSFLPEINGIFVKSPNKMHIEVKMQMERRVNIFAVLWCLGIGIGGTWELLKLNTQKTGMPSYIPLLMIVLMYLMIMITFKSESRKSIKDLEECFDTKAIYA